MSAGEIAVAQFEPARSVPARVYLALVAGMVCISLTAIFTKWAAMPGPVAAVYRMSIAALALALPFWLYVRRKGVPSLADAGVASLGGFWFALNLVLLNSALLLTSAATATLLDNTAPIWVGLGSMVVFGQRLSRRYWLGLAVALSGAAIVTGIGAGGLPNSGNVLAAVGAVFYAAYLLTTQHARSNLSNLVFLWIAEVTSAVVLLVVCLLMGLSLVGYDSRAYLAMLGVGLVSQTGGWLLITYALGHLPASTAVVILLGQPVVTGLLSIPLLGESLSVPQIVGGLVLLAGINLCLRPTGAG